MAAKENNSGDSPSQERSSVRPPPFHIASLLSTDSSSREKKESGEASSSAHANSPLFSHHPSLQSLMSVDRPTIYSSKKCMFIHHFVHRPSMRQCRLHALIFIILHLINYLHHLSAMALTYPPCHFFLRPFEPHPPPTALPPPSSLPSTPPVDTAVPSQKEIQDSLHCRPNGCPGGEVCRE